MMAGEVVESFVEKPRFAAAAKQVLWSMAGRTIDAILTAKSVQRWMFLVVVVEALESESDSLGR